MIHINLLPGAQKRKLRQELIKVLSIAFSMFALTALGLGIVISIVFSQKLAVQANIDTLDKQIAEQQSQIQSYTKVITASNTLRTKLTMVNDVVAQKNLWSSYLTSLNQSLPKSGVKFINLNVASDYNMTVSGIASSSVDLAKLLSALKRAYATFPKNVNKGDTLAKIVATYKTDADLILKVNNAAAEADLLKLSQIQIARYLFKSVEIASVNLQTDAKKTKEVEKSVSFTLTLVLKDTALNETK